ncbi:MAG: hypothetical protein H7263_00800, partial [Candidatus Sericytochromatia bacterium]|nr:hypothetical protein [Candidatus Sericytochromatia bacterium]
IKSYPDKHPFATDLDIIGNNSLYRLLDISVSEDGSQTLLNWLLNQNPNLKEIEKRQSIVKELKELTHFRDKLLLKTFLLSSKSFQKWQGKRVLNWVKQNNDTKEIKKVLNIASVMVISNYLLYFISLFNIAPNLWKISFVIYAIYFFMNDKFAKEFFKEAIDLQFELRKLNAILGYLEKFNYGKNKNLAEFCQPFKDEKIKPSNYLRRIKNLVASASIQSNPMIWLMSNAIFPWDFFHGYRLKKYKSEIADIIPIWLDKVFDLEAMISLANFADLNPDYIFPDLVEKIETQDHSQFNFKNISHPLIEENKKVANDFSMKNIGDSIIITGSNMAGKSTFMRTLGINLSLAYAGGVVNADIFETRLFRIFTCIKVSDSVTDGLSYFYAEVKRLKELLNALEKEDNLPLFFLIDEIFRGTNNRERLIGSQSLIQALTKQNGIGLISTHDLELVKLADTISEIKNYHFRDEILDDKMIFSYKLHEGPCPTTNALKIMRIEGLPV